MELQLEVRHDGAVAVLRPVGEIDAESAPQLEQCIALVLRSGVEQVILDFDEVSFIDSSGLYVLVRSAHRIRGKAKIVITNPRDHVHKVLSITGADRTITVAASEDFILAVASGQSARPPILLPS